MSRESSSALMPFLLPSGPRWSEQFTDRTPPPTVRYWGRRWRVTWHKPFEGNATTGKSWPEGAWVLTRDKGTFWGRLWWRHVVLGWARLLWRLRARGRAQVLGDRASAYPFGGAKLEWRCEIGPEGKPWHTGDPQGQDGHWPVSIAVFDRQPGDDWVAKNYYAGATHAAAE